MSTLSRWAEGVADEHAALVMLVLSALLVAFCVAFVVSLFVNESNYRDFMRECQADGKKHYECVALWRDDS